MFDDNYPMMLFMLLMAHFLADYPLQGQYLSDAKNPNHPLGKDFWALGLFSHGVIHGGFVALITGYWVLGLLEVIFHMSTDYLKCQGEITAVQDQWRHILHKFLWFTLVVAFELKPLH